VLADKSRAGMRLAGRHGQFGETQTEGDATRRNRVHTDELRVLQRRIGGKVYVADVRLKDACREWFMSHNRQQISQFRTRLC
jgi:hypothetical protein